MWVVSMVDLTVDWTVGVMAVTLGVLLAAVMAELKEALMVVQ
jgi:hypothetical protein